MAALRLQALPLLAGLLIEAAWAGLVWLGPLQTQIPRFWALLLPAFLGYLAAAWWVWRRPAGPLWSLLGLALLFRLTLLLSEPSLSDDIYRYVWDGRVQRAGINPYLHAPESPEVAQLRNGLYAGINHKDLSTIYPPLAQFFFLGVCAVHPGIWAMKGALVAVELGLVLLLVRILRQRGQDQRRVLLYAWNPLPVIEVAGSGHLDVLAVSLLLLALYWLEAGRRLPALWAAAGALLAKFLPALALPLFWQRLQGQRRLLWWLPLLVGLGFLPYIGAGLQLFAGLQAYLLKWRFNDALFSTVYQLLRDPALGQDEAALHQAKLLGAGLLGLVVLWACWRITDLYRATFTILGAYLLLTPTLHPWYLMWVLPFLALFPAPAWLYLSGAIFLAYDVLSGYSNTGIWEERPWVLWAEFLPFYLLLLGLPLYRFLKRRTH
ncbi:MAG: hypothetical protein IT369_24245 [Candidatus Latescibacteria bacterium]|nr:hypothetical protein [Candidatus Latescibacterota bacterium]